MALNLRRNFKTYYSIREVAEMFDLNESTLRYWEQEFSFLRPKTSGTAKIRQYQEKDIEQIKLIHNLVKVRGFKISAARDILQKNRKGAETIAKALSELIEMRTELEKLRDHLEML
jgi:DNA-binding transcriptional MerR regulator